MRICLFLCLCILFKGSDCISITNSVCVCVCTDPSPAKANLCRYCEAGSSFAAAEVGSYWTEQDTCWVCATTSWCPGPFTGRFFSSHLTFLFQKFIHWRKCSCRHFCFLLQERQETEEATNENLEQCRHATLHSVKEQLEESNSTDG